MIFLEIPLFANQTGFTCKVTITNFYDNTPATDTPGSQVRDDKQTVTMYSCSSVSSANA